MKNHLRSTILTLVGIAMLSGCAATQNRISSGYYQKEIVPNTHTYFRQVWAGQDDEQFRVSGYLRLKGIGGFDVPDYVEVALVKPDGEILDLKKVLYFPRSLYERRGHREGRFSAGFNYVPPPGSTIRLSNVN